jgi:hypothetical protein
MYCATPAGTSVVLRSAEDQGRHAHGRQHVAHVDLLVHPVQCLDRAGTRAEAEQVERRLQLVSLEATEHADGVGPLCPRTENA